VASTPVGRRWTATSRSTSRPVVVATSATSKPWNANRNASRFAEHDRPAQPDFEDTQRQCLEHRGLLGRPRAPDVVVVAAERGVAGTGPGTPWPAVGSDGDVAHPTQCGRPNGGAPSPEHVREAPASAIHVFLDSGHVLRDKSGGSPRQGGGDGTQLAS